MSGCGVRCVSGERGALLRLTPLIVLNEQGGRKKCEVLEQLTGAFNIWYLYLPRNLRTKETRFVTAFFPSWSCHLGCK